MDALKRYTRQRGGWSLSSPYMEGFKCQALAFGMGEADLQETRLAFQDSTQVCTVLYPTMLVLGGHPPKRPTG